MTGSEELPPVALIVPRPASLRWHPDRMELEGLARALGEAGGMRARFSDAQGRERATSSWNDLRSASGVVVLETASTRIVTSDALFCFAAAECGCGADAHVDIHEVYKRTHGGPAPARLLHEFSLGEGLRGRCKKCKKTIDRANVVTEVEEPFAHVAVFVRGMKETNLGLLAALRRASGFSWRRAH